MSSALLTIKIVPGSDAVHTNIVVPLTQSADGTTPYTSASALCAALIEQASTVNPDAAVFGKLEYFHPKAKKWVKLNDAVMKTVS